MENIDFIANLHSQRTMLPKHLDISSRKVTYWKERDILPFFEKEKHAKMNIPEAVWLYLINELASLGIDYKHLAALAKDVWDKPRVDGYLDRKLEMLINSPFSKREESSKIYENLKKDEKLKIALLQEINPFTDGIIESILIEKNPLKMFYIPSTGDHHFSTGDIQLPLNLLNHLNELPFICIPLVPIIKKIVSVEFLIVNREFSYLSNAENEIKDIVLYKAPKYVEIVIDNNTLKPLIIREQHKSAEQLAVFFLNNKLPKNARLLIELRSQGNYKITIITK